MAQVGLEMVAPVALGWWLDERLGLRPWLLVVGVVVGFSIGILHLTLLSRDKTLTRDHEPPPPKQPPPKDKEP
jgi:F0F1-type ATP synthase assembly protein I